MEICWDTLDVSELHLSKILSTCVEYFKMRLFPDISTIHT